MPRKARIVVPSVPHHITQRGNNRQDVFFVDDDREVYLHFLREQSDIYGLEILGYCLMTNHIHLIATPKNKESLAKAIGRTNFYYTQYINRMHGRSGHLWQNRFYSCPLDKPHFWLALRYIETNPVRAKMVRDPAKYKWSSVAIHLGKKQQTELIDVAKWRQISARIDWEQQLKKGCNDQEMKLVRNATHVGRPLGRDSFMSKMEKVIGKRLRPLPVGRPKKISSK